MKKTITPNDVCCRCDQKRSAHGVSQLCPPFDKNWNLFKSKESVDMKATDLVNAFEQEWFPKYPDIRHFTVDAVVTDIAYWRKIELDQEHKPSLVRFLVKYLKEHPGRFQYGGMNGFRVLKHFPEKPVPYSPN